MIRVAILIDGGHLRILARQEGHNPYDANFIEKVALACVGQHETPQLASKDLFAVRRGDLKFRGFKPKNIPISARPLTDDDFEPDFEQKGVDMRIGLDIATFCRSRAVERIVLVTGDTDCVPAMKHARIDGLQVVLVVFPNQRIAPELRWHADFQRQVKWPQ